MKKNHMNFVSIGKWEISALMQSGISWYFRVVLVLTLMLLWNDKCTKMLHSMSGLFDQGNNKITN